MNLVGQEKNMEVQQQEKQSKINQSINEIETTAPGKLRVIKRNGKVVAFVDDKIKVAITKAFLATESGNAAASERIHKKVNSQLFKKCYFWGCDVEN